MCLFDRLYSATDELREKARKPFVKKKLQREFETAIDSAEMQKLEAEEKLQQLQENIKNYDLNKYLELRSDLEAIERTIEVLKEHKEEMFNK